MLVIDKVKIGIIFSTCQEAKKIFKKLFVLTDSIGFKFKSYAPLNTVLPTLKK